MERVIQEAVVARHTEHREVATGKAQDRESVGSLVGVPDPVRENGFLLRQPQAWLRSATTRRPRQVELDYVVDVRNPLAFWQPPLLSTVTVICIEVEVLLRMPEAT